MSTPTTKTEMLKSQMHELIKSHTTLDGSGRPSAIYTAQADAINGASCTRVDYTYDTTYTTSVIGMKESYSTWDSSWDI